MRVQARPAKPLVAPAPRRQQPVEADVKLRATMQGDVLATGQVTLTRGFMEVLVKHLFRKPKSFGQHNVAFDPQTGTYKGTVVVKIKGKYPITLDAQAKPMVDGNQPAFQLQKVGIQLWGKTFRLPFFNGLAAKLIAGEIKGDVGATAAKGGIVRMDPTALMQEIDALPAGLRMSKDIQWTTQVAANGDIQVKLDGGVAGSLPADTEHSDLTVTAESGTVQRLLAPVLGQDFQLKNVQFGTNTVALVGEVEAKPLSDVANLGKLLLGALLGREGVDVSRMNASRVMIPLTLNLQLDGMTATLTPSLSLAAKELEKTFQKANIAYERVGGSIRFDLRPLVAKYGVKSIKATPEGLEADAALDIPGLMKAPILRDGIKALRG